MAEPTLTLRALNRTTLSRQMLLQRSTIDIPVAMERLFGLQAQVSAPPFVGLWTRLKGFRRQDLADLIESKSVVKSTWIRATLHLCTTRDYLRFRASLQPMLSQVWSTLSKGRKLDFDLDEFLERARRFIGEKPRSFAEISAWVAESMPGQDVGAARYAVRTHLPLVQVPTATDWSYPAKPEFALAEDWIGDSIHTRSQPQELVRRYLAAFGPASAADLQAWLGMPMKDTIEELRSELRSHRDGRRELFDLSDMELVSEDTPAPVRFLPEFDNLLLSHTKRTRVIADEHRTRVYLPGLRVAATFLVDGFVAGTWKVEKSRTTATLLINPFQTLTKSTRRELTDEAGALVRFLENRAKSHNIRFIDPS